MKIIVAVDKNWGIGKDNDLLFSLKKDMSYFRQNTMGAVVVMGRKTFESLPNKQPLKGRKNIILSSACFDLPEGDVMQVKTLEELLAEIKNIESDNIKKVFVIGGASVYKTLLPYCSHALITKVDADGGAEVFFPNLDSLSGWQCIFESETQDDGGYKIKFTEYKNLAAKEF